MFGLFSYILLGLKVVVSTLFNAKREQFRLSVGRQLERSVCRC